MWGAVGRWRARAAVVAGSVWTVDQECGASVGSGSMEWGVAGGRLGEVLEASGMGRAQYRS